MDRVKSTATRSTASLPCLPVRWRAGHGWLGQRFMVAILSSALLSAGSHAEQPESADFSGLDQEVRALKKEVLEINRELLQLEEQLLYPKPQQLVIFVSVEKPAPVKLENLSIELNGEVIARHRYNASQNSALAEGGVHRPYLGTVQNGEHRLSVSVSYASEDGRMMQQSATRTIAKRGQPKYLELRVGRSGFSKTPEVKIYEW